MLYTTGGSCRNQAQYAEKYWSTAWKNADLTPGEREKPPGSYDVSANSGDISSSP